MFTKFKKFENILFSKDENKNKKMFTQSGLSVEKIELQV